MIFVRIAFVLLAIALSALLWTGASGGDQSCVTTATVATSSAVATVDGEQQSGVVCR